MSLEKLELEIIHYKELCLNLKNSVFEKLITNLKIIFNFLTKNNINNCIKSNNKDNIILISFNGGKDSICSFLAYKYLLYCMHINLSNENNMKLINTENTLNNIEDINIFNKFLLNHTKFKINNYFNTSLIYFSHSDNFKEEVDYCIDISKSEDINIKIMHASFRNGLFYSKEKYKFDYIVMGLRKDDLFLSSSTFANNINQDDYFAIEEKDIIQSSTNSYPNFIRLYPIYNFNYSEIWCLILLFNYKYLCLYDQGYSSVGLKKKTFKNSNLFRHCYNKYMPAYCLYKSSSEREFRTN